MDQLPGEVLSTVLAYSLRTLPDHLRIGLVSSRCRTRCAARLRALAQSGLGGLQEAGLALRLAAAEERSGRGTPVSSPRSGVRVPPYYELLDTAAAQAWPHWPSLDLVSACRRLAPAHLPDDDPELGGQYLCTRCTRPVVKLTHVDSNNYTYACAPAYLLRKCLPGALRARGDKQEVEYLSGRYTVQKCFCAHCDAEMGVTYVGARDPENQYKVGKFMVTTKNLMWPKCCDRHRGATGVAVGDMCRGCKRLGAQRVAALVDRLTRGLEPGKARPLLALLDQEEQGVFAGDTGVFAGNTDTSPVCSPLCDAACYRVERPPPAVRFAERLRFLPWEDPADHKSSFTVPARERFGTMVSAAAEHVAEAHAQLGQPRKRTWSNSTASTLASESDFDELPCEGSALVERCLQLPLVAPPIARAQRVPAPAWPAPPAPAQRVPAQRFPAPPAARPERRERRAASWAQTVQALVGQVRRHIAPPWYP